MVIPGSSASAQPESVRLRLTFDRQATAGRTSIGVTRIDASSAASHTKLLETASPHFGIPYPF
ncbi:hypothetical protein ABH922_004929 [Rhodococcus sp. 27YEA15]